MNAIDTINSIQSGAQNNFELVAGDGLVITSDRNALQFNVSIIGSANISVTVLPNGTLLLESAGGGGGGGGGGVGTVTSVGLSLPESIISTSGTPVTDAGTLTGSLVAQDANTVWAGPPGRGSAAAAPGFRPLVDADIPDALSLTMLGVNGTTLLGTNTTCLMPLQPSCYDISNQACTGGPLAANCVPDTLHLANLVVDNLIVVNGTVSVDYVNSSFFGDITLNGTQTCVGNASISNGCLNLGGYTCPVGIPLADSCIPASLSFYDMAVTHALTVNSVTCASGVLGSDCIPDRLKTINGISPTAAPDLDFSIVGTTNQVIVTPGTATITLSTPQNIHIGATPTFLSTTLSSASNQLTLGTATTINAVVPASPVIYTIHDAGANANFVLDTGGPLTITNAASLPGYVLTVTGTNTSSWQTPATVTSVALNLPASVFSVSGPVTTNGTLTGTLVNQSANTVWAGPTSGADATPAFRGLVSNDLPSTAHFTALVVDNLSGSVNGTLTCTGAGRVDVSCLPISVSSVGLALPASIFNVSDPVTTNGTLIGTLVTQSANTVWAGPATGPDATPTFRDLVSADLPSTAHFTTLMADNLMVDNLYVVTDTIAAVTYAGVAYIGNAFVNGTVSCVGAGNVDPSCLPVGVSSVALALPVSVFTVSGAVTSTGTLTGAFTNQNANTVFAGPASGGAGTPTFRPLVAADVPSAVVLDNIASPTAYPTQPQTDGVWYGQGAKAGSASASSVVLGNNGTAATGSVSVGNLATATGNSSVAVGPNATSNSIATSVSIGSGSTVVDAAHAFGLGINTASVLPGLIGVTVNGASYQWPQYASLYAVTSTFAGVTTLTATSAHSQYFTGTQSQTVVLPDVTTLANGFSFKIINLSGGGFVTVESSGGTVIAILPTVGGWGTATCVDIGGGTGVSSWSFEWGVASTRGQSNVAIGGGASAIPIGGTAIGYNSVAVGQTSVALGMSANSAATSAISIGYLSSAAASGAVAAGPSATVGSSGTNSVAIGNAATANNLATVVSLGSSSNITDTAHAFGLGINAASVNPGSIGVTVNGASYQWPQYTSLYATTVTSGGTTTLTATSAHIQYFTGTLTQTVTLPVVTTLSNGFYFKIVNIATTNGAVTVQTSGANVITVLPISGGWGTFTCVNTAGGTGTASWSFESGVSSSIGSTSSFGAGYGVKAKGASSVAVGVGAITVAFGSVAIGNVATDGAGTGGTNSVAIGNSATANNLVNAVSLGSSSTITDTAHAFGLGINTASVNPGSIGVTVNGASYQWEQYTSRFATTVTTGGMTTLTAASAQIQVFTGTLTHQVALPVVTTLANGYWFRICSTSSASSGVIIVTSALNDLIQLPHNGGCADFICINTAGGTGIASWVIQAAISTPALNFGLAVGGGSEASGTQSAAIGTGALSTGTSAFGLGNNVIANGANAIVIGIAASSGTGTDQIIIGNNAGASVSTGTPNIGIGTSVLSAKTTFTGSISATVSGTGSTSGSSTTLTMTASITFVTGQSISGTGVTAGTYIVTGATGTTFTMSQANTIASTTITGAPTITFTSATSGALVVGMTISGTGVTAGTVVSSLVQGTVNVAGSTYISSVSQTTASTTITGFSAASQCTSIGYQSLKSNVGNANTAVGYQSLLAVAAGTNNAAFGNLAGNTLTTGSFNVMVGNNAQVGTTISNAVSIGSASTVTDTAHAFGLGINTASVNPGTIGVTVNGASYQWSQYTSWFATTVTSGGTTTLTATSAYIQYFTGSSSHTVVLPVVTTLANGFSFKIVNAATAGSLTVRTSAPTTYAILPSNEAWGVFTCIDITAGTGVASWSYESGPGQTTTGSIVYGSGASTLSGSNAISIGNSASSTVSGCITIGPGGSCTASTSIAFGYSASVAAANSAVIGYSASAASGGSNSVVIGYQASTGSTNTIAIGPSAQVGTSVPCAIAIGFSAFAGSSDCIAFGSSATTQSSTNSITMGKSASTGSGDSHIIIGNLAGTNQLTGSFNIAIGTSVLSAATSFTGSIKATVTGTGSTSGLSTTLTMTASITFVTGQAISGAGVAAGTYIVTGATGTTFTMSQANTITSTTITGAPTLTKSAGASTTLTVGMQITGSGVTTGTLITSLTQGGLSAIGSTYTVSVSQTVASVAMSGFSGASQSVGIGYQALTTDVGGKNTALGYQAMTIVAGGTNNVAMGNIAGNILTIGSNNVMVGYNAQVGAAVSNAISLGASSSVTATGAVAIGPSIVNSVASTVVFGSTSETMRILDPAVGGYTFLLQKSTQAGASPQTLTAAQSLGGYQEITTAGAFALTLDTGANLDANVQLAGNLYVGQSFRCVVVGTGAATQLTLAGSTGTTLKGTAVITTNAAVQLLFVRTGAAAWDVVSIQG